MQVGHETRNASADVTCERYAQITITYAIYRIVLFPMTLSDLE